MRVRRRRQPPSGDGPGERAEAGVGRVEQRPASGASSGGRIYRQRRLRRRPGRRRGCGRIYRRRRRRRPGWRRGSNGGDGPGGGDPSGVEAAAEETARAAVTRWRRGAVEEATGHGEGGSGGRQKNRRRQKVLEVNRLAANLQSYLEQRGATLPDGHITRRVVLPNPNCRPSYTITLQPEVIMYDQWKDLKADSKSGFSTWIKGAFQGSKSDMQDSLPQNLHFILSTSPMWDRLELKGDKNVLGEFIEFKGRHDDIQVLKNLKRSKVSRFIIQKSTLFGGFGRSRVQILYSPRDYRAEGTSSSEWKEISVKQYTEILFQPLHSKKVRKFKLSSVVSVTLSA